MIEVAALDFIKKINVYWHKKIGLVLVQIFWISMIVFAKDFINHDKFSKYLPIVFIIVSISIWFIWYLTTKRFIIRGNNDLVISVMVLVDNEEEVKCLYKISKNSIEKVKNTSELKNVKLVYLPSNFLSSVEQVKKYINRNSSNLDLFLILHAQSGNFQNDHKIEINHFEFVYNLNNIPIKTSILFEKVEFISEIKFQNFHKKWIILNSNSFEDRAIVKDNFVDLLYHTIAIEYLLLGKNEKSLAILEKLLKIEETRININLKNTQQIKIKPQALSQGRILHLLSTLYLAISDRYMYSNPHKTFEFLKRLEVLIPIHKYSFIQYIRMARMCYECGNLDLAESYTEKAAQINRRDPTPNINRAFFGVLKSNWGLIYRNLLEIFHQKKHITNGIVDVVDFLCTQRKKHPHLQIKFDFVINFYEALFLDRENGKKCLSNILETLRMEKEENAPNTIMHLAKKVIELE